jgi:hypothetical protein
MIQIYELTRSLVQPMTKCSTVRISYKEHPKPDQLAAEIFETLRDLNQTLEHFTFSYDYDRESFVFRFLHRDPAIILKLKFG